MRKKIGMIGVCGLVGLMNIGCVPVEFLTNPSQVVARADVYMNTLLNAVFVYGGWVTDNVGSLTNLFGG